MNGLLLLLTETGTERAAAALEVAAVTAALQRPVAVLLRGAALDVLQGSPALEMLRELGAEVAVCQTAMAAQGLASADLPTGVEPAGLVSFLAGRADWQLLLA